MIGLFLSSVVWLYGLSVVFSPESAYLLLAFVFVVFLPVVVVLLLRSVVLSSIFISYPLFVYWLSLAFDLEVPGPFVFWRVVPAFCP